MRYSLVFALFVAGLAQAADKLVGGPYVVRPTDRSVTIGWVIETDTVATGAAAGQADRRVPVLRCEKVSMTGLKAGETVYYEIPPSAGGAAPELRKGHFKTPPTGSASFQFVVFGDTRTRHELHRKVVDAVVKTDPDFVLHTGDLVADGYDTAQWPVFFDIERELLRKTVFFPVLGNHERDNARFHEFFDVKTPYYSFNWGSAHFALLDSDLINYSGSAIARDRFWDEQIRWLDEDLGRSQKADFRFVIMHHPAITVNQKNVGHVSKEAAALVPLFERQKVTAVFAGHHHNYQRHVKNGVQYIVTGGGGAPLSPADPPLPDGITKKVESVEHFVTIKVEGDRGRVEVIALDGRVIESVELAAKGRD
ncbi:MAG: metallophosphoesterase [Acidobacteria bacterium]|nr:metallophosphoesterase [Acidobacteriota bacterium]